VAQRFPKAELGPLADPFALAQVQEFNSYLCSTVHVAHAHRMRGTRWADDAAAIEAMKRKVPSNVRECFELIEHKFMNGPWVMGDKYTICDPYLFTIASWIEGDGVDTTKVPRALEHRARMLARPAVSKGCGCRRHANSLTITRTSNGSESAGQSPAANLSKGRSRPRPSQDRTLLGLAE
jgi:glutathione S-transferase